MSQLGTRSVRHSQLALSGDELLTSFEILSLEERVPFRLKQCTNYYAVASGYTSFE